MTTARDRDAAELAALRKRFPKPTNAGAAFQVATILVINGYLAYLVARHELSPLAIAVFSLAELGVMIVIAQLAHLGVPRESRLSDARHTPLQKIFSLAFLLLWLGVVYFLCLSLDTRHIQELRAAPTLLAAWQSLNITLPLLLTAGVTAFGTVSDLLRWRGTGGLFVPSYALSAAPKILTALFAPIPAALIAASYAKVDLATGLTIWSLVYLAIKTLSEFLILAFQYFGMPEAQPKTYRARG